MPSEAALAAAREWLGEFNEMTVELAEIIDRYFPHAKHTTPPSSVAVRVPVAMSQSKDWPFRVLCNDGVVFWWHEHLEGWRELPPIPGTLAALERGASDSQQALSVATKGGAVVTDRSGADPMLAGSSASAGAGGADQYERDVRGELLADVHESIARRVFGYPTPTEARRFHDETTWWNAMKRGHPHAWERAHSDATAIIQTVLDASGVSAGVR